MDSFNCNMVHNANILSVQDCRLIIKRHLQSNEFEVLQTEQTPILTYSGSYFSIKIKILINNMESNMEFVAKQLGHQTKEIFSYEFLFKDFKDQWPSFDLNFTPKYYFSKDDSLVVFEDFFKQGFVFPTTSLDIDHIKLVLKALAKYHAGSIGFQQTKKKILGKQYKLVDEYSVFLKPNEMSNEIWLKEKVDSFNFDAGLLHTTGLTSNEFKEKLHKIIEGAFEIQPKTTYMKVLCHGFLCKENILFRYNMYKTPVECKLVNFELQRYKPPAFDVLQLIYLATTQEVRKIHLHDLLEFYYHSLTAEAKFGNLVIEDCFTRQDFYESVHHALPLMKIQIAHLQSLTANKNFIKELQDLIVHPRLTAEDCFKIVKNKTGTTNYELLDYKIIPLGTMYGYLGDHNKLKIDVSINNKNTTLNLFAKFMPKTSSATSIAMDIGAFQKEAFVYEQFIPTIQNLGIKTIDTCGVPCYFSRRDDVMIFEDFDCQNYKTLDSRQPFTYEIVQVVIRKLAKFHASSIILEEKLSRKSRRVYRLNDHYQRELQDGLFSNSENHKGAKCTKVGMDSVEHELELFPDLNSETSAEKMKIKVRKAYQRVYELVKPSKKFRNVVCHGDLWINNILIQFSDGKPIDCRFIDYQLCRYCPPAHDLLTFIYLTTNRSFRSRRFNDSINLYYQEISRHLRNYGCDVEQICPYDNFIESIEYMIPQAVCQTAFYFQLCVINADVSKEYLGNEEQVQKVLLNDRKDFITAMFERDPLFRERAGESIQDLREMCAKYY